MEARAERGPHLWVLAPLISLKESLIQQAGCSLDGAYLGRGGLAVPPCGPWVSVQLSPFVSN